MPDPSSRLVLVQVGGRGPTLLRLGHRHQAGLAVVAVGVESDQRIAGVDGDIAVGVFTGELREFLGSRGAPVYPVNPRGTGFFFFSGSGRTLGKPAPR